MQEITGDVLLELTPESLKELDIGTFGKRHKIYNAIQALRQETIRVGIIILQSNINRLMLLVG